MVLRCASDGCGLVAHCNAVEAIRLFFKQLLQPKVLPASEKRFACANRERSGRLMRSSLCSRGNPQRYCLMRIAFRLSRAINQVGLDRTRCLVADASDLAPRIVARFCSLRSPKKRHEKLP